MSKKLTYKIRQHPMQGRDRVLIEATPSPWGPDITGACDLASDPLRYSSSPPVAETVKVNWSCCGALAIQDARTFFHAGLELCDELERRAIKAGVLPDKHAGLRRRPCPSALKRTRCRAKIRATTAGIGRHSHERNHQHLPSMYGRARSRPPRCCNYDRDVPERSRLCGMWMVRLAAWDDTP